MDPKPNTAPFGATQPPTTSSAPVPTPPFNTNPPPMQPAQAQVIKVDVLPDWSPTIVTILLLLFLAPIGIIVMWIWPKWKVWVKVLITSISVLPILFAIIASVALVAINPAAQFRKANNTTREVAVNTITRNLEQVIADNRGALPSEVLPAFVGAEPVSLASSSGPGMIALCEHLTGIKGSGSTMSRLPIDPSLLDKGEGWKSCQDFDTGYEISVSGTQVTVTAPLMEVEASPVPQQ